MIVSDYVYILCKYTKCVRLFLRCSHVVAGSLLRW